MKSANLHNTKGSVIDHLLLKIEGLSIDARGQTPIDVYRDVYGKLIFIYIECDLLIRDGNIHMYIWVHHYHK